MASNAILFIDLLGVQKMWVENGAPAVKSRIEEFNNFILDQLNWLPGALHRDGDYRVILSGDSASIVCQDFDQAIGIGVHFFTSAFFAKNVSKALWLRGAIERWHNQYLTFNNSPIKAKGIDIGTQYVNEDDYLRVLALEKSGFKGMRLVVDRGILPNFGMHHRVEWKDFVKPLYVVTNLKGLTYPRGDGYMDVLWMAAHDAEKFEMLKGIMAQRFKYSTSDPDEFTQASWTRAAFDQVDTLIWQCRGAGAGVATAARADS